MLDLVAIQDVALPVVSMQAPDRCEPVVRIQGSSVSQVQVLPERVQGRVAKLGVIACQDLVVAIGSGALKVPDAPGIYGWQTCEEGVCEAVAINNSGVFVGVKPHHSYIA